MRMHPCSLAMAVTHPSLFHHVQETEQLLEEDKKLLEYVDDVDHDMEGGHYQATNYYTTHVHVVHVTSVRCWYFFVKVV